jgi:hypothetical protein
VPSSVRPIHVLINTLVVAVKISVDYVLGFQGSFGEDFGLDFLDIFGDGVLVGTEVFILLVRRRVLRVEASSGALWSDVVNEN